MDTGNRKVIKGGSPGTAVNILHSEALGAVSKLSIEKHLRFLIWW